MPRTIFRIAALAGIAAVLLGYGIQRAELGAVIGDPIGGIRAQDETTYANSALTAATQGGWLTPKVMGRLYLIKPPLLIWLSGFSLKLLGVTRLALRLPVLAAAIFATVLLFLWAEKARSSGSAVLAGLFAVSNPLWHTYARVCYTDMLLAAAIMAAMWVLLRDPEMSKRSTVIAFGICTAVAVMAKNVAGFLPLAILLLSLVMGRRRIRWKAVAHICVLAALLLLPWHIYELATHTRWFVADYIEFQLFRSGVTPPAQSSQEGQAGFYLKRLWLMDPLLCIGGLLAAPSLAAALRRRKPEASLLAAWLTLSGAALLAFQYRNLPYLLYAIPALCLMAAMYGPLSSGWRQRAAIAVMAVAFCGRVLLSGHPWTLSFGAPPSVPGAETLRAYAKLARESELMVVNPDDEYYSSVLALPGVRYCFLDPTGAVERYVPHYNYLGITMSAATFADLERRRPEFRKRLREWGLDSGEPIGTVIVAHSERELMELIAAHPRSDFYLPVSLRQAAETVAEETHEAVDVPAERFFLMAREVPNGGRALPKWWNAGVW